MAGATTRRRRTRSRVIELVIAAMLMFRDPPGDAVGAGNLVPPSAERYRNPGSFDLIEIRILDTAMLAVEIELGALPNPADLANGFSNPVIDLYFDLAEGGREDLLPGPEMRMPPGLGWELALRISGDGATAHRSDVDSAAGTTISYPVRVMAEDRTVRVDTPFERESIAGLYALTGVYDPFVVTGWRPLSEDPSPWAFSSVDQQRPVIDLLAADSVAQAEAIRAGYLPRVQERTGGAAWMLLMVMGIVVAMIGLVMRRQVVREPAPAVESPDAPAIASDSAPDSADARPESIEGRPADVPVVLPAFLPALPPPRASVTEEAVEPTDDFGFGAAESWMDEGDADARDAMWDDQEDEDDFQDLLVRGRDEDAPDEDAPDDDRDVNGDDAAHAEPGGDSDTERTGS